MTINTGKSPFEMYPQWLARQERHAKRQRFLATMFGITAIATLVAAWLLALVQK